MLQLIDQCTPQSKLFGSKCQTNWKICEVNPTWDWGCEGFHSIYLSLENGSNCVAMNHDEGMKITCPVFRGLIVYKSFVCNKIQAWSFLFTQFTTTSISVTYDTAYTSRLTAWVLFAFLVGYFRLGRILFDRLVGNKEKLWASKALTERDQFSPFILLYF